MFDVLLQGFSVDYAKSYRLQNQFFTKLYQKLQNQIFRDRDFSLVIS